MELETLPVLLAIIVVAAVAVALRVWAVLPSKGTWPPKAGPVKLLVVLGSGGHTTEMFYDLATLPDWGARYRAVYVVADTDKGSAGKAEEYEGGRGTGPARVLRVPRAREVGQSYVTSVFTTLHSAVSCFRIVFSELPDAVLCNGPGTCVPICAAAYAARVFCVKRIGVVYSESMACVDHLSMSGKILLPFADRFTVQWDPLLHKLRSTRARHAGRCTAASPLPELHSLPGDGTALVTVGSTRFDALIEACDDKRFLQVLKTQGITRIVVQRGNGSYVPKNITGCAEVVQYSPDIPKIIKTASLVVSHAGAGTVLDCLLHDRRLLVVPNEQLMANHQVQLAEELSKFGLLQWCRPHQLIETLEKPLPQRRCFPKEPTSVFRDSVRDLVG